MIFKIIEEYPDYAFMVRFNLVEMQILPDLVTRLTAIYCRDTVRGEKELREHLCIRVDWKIKPFCKLG